jgi:hypothetical protein
VRGAQVQAEVDHGKEHREQQAGLEQRRRVLGVEIEERTAAVEAQQQELEALQRQRMLVNDRANQVTSEAHAQIPMHKYILCLYTNTSRVVWDPACAPHVNRDTFIKGAIHHKHIKQVQPFELNPEQLEMSKFDIADFLFEQMWRDYAEGTDNVDGMLAAGIGV